MNTHEHSRCGGFSHDHGDHSFVSELKEHLPYAISSVAFSLAALSFISYGSLGFTPEVARKGTKMLFHAFHFMHIVYAASGTLITFFRFSKNTVVGILVGILSSMTFCTLSDAIIPYLGGTVLGVQMKWHLCFVTEWHNIIPFLVAGLINGYLLSSRILSKQVVYSLVSHSIHISISSLASSFYLVSHGFPDWYKQIGYVFLFLIVAVVVPCTLSDIVVPMFFARVVKRNEKHSA